MEKLEELNQGMLTIAMSVLTEEQINEADKLSGQMYDQMYKLIGNREINNMVAYVAMLDLHCQLTGAVRKSVEGSIEEELKEDSEAEK